MDPRWLALENKPKPYIVAHRGNQVACPENTLAAFRQAITDGADILETDLHLTADGVFVCIHDDKVDRTTDGSGEVARMTLDQVKSLSAACGRQEYEGERIPALAEFAAIVPKDVIIALELKSDRFLEDKICRQLIDELDRTGVRDRTIVLSFSLNRLRTMRAVAPDIPIGSITLNNPFPSRETNLAGPFWPLLLLNPFYVLMAHRHGQIVCPLDPAPDSRLWLYRWLKCDAILTNDPASTNQALKRTGVQPH
jgi:glycerophosphoryl diester phosphodiesterase